METLGAFLDAAVARDPAREAIAFAPGAHVTVRMTWAELGSASRTAAKKLLALGVVKGSRVGLLCSNRIEWLSVAFGALRLGAVLVPLPTLWRREELQYGLRHADVHLLVMLPRFRKHDYVESLNDIVTELGGTTPGRLYSPALPFLRRVVLLEDEAPGTEGWVDVPASADDAFLDACEAVVSPADVATVLFTSGSTAQAKAVVHCHAALVTAAREVSACLGVTGEDCCWAHMPLFWSGGFVLGALAIIAGGGRIVLQEVVEPAAALELLESEGCTVMAGWHQAAPLIEHPDFSRRRLRLRKGTGANYHLATRLLVPDHVAVTNYGMTETATVITSTRWNEPHDVRVGTFGRPLGASEVRIVDPTSRRSLPPGEVGEILVCGPTVMEEYYRVPRIETFDADGFFRTGDLGDVDTDGRLRFVARLKDVIKTAGVNVAASEVEAALTRHPTVKSAHVVGVADAARGESVAAFVVLVPDAAAKPAALQRFCRDRLAGYAVPRHLFVVAEAEVPRTGSGKVDKAALRRDAEARLATRGRPR